MNGRGCPAFLARGYPRALLAGITVDTKHFAFNVGSRTFEAAGYLRKNGADISMVKQMFQDDMASYQACSEAVKSAEILPGGIAISKCLKTEGCEENEKLIAAKVAELKETDVETVAAVTTRNARELFGI